MFAEILVHHPYSRKQECFTYEIPEGFSVERGSGVEVPFQKGKKPGLILRIHNEKPSFETRAISGLLRDEELLFDWQLKLADWISEYYFCSLFDALRLMLPKNIFRVSKKTRVVKETLKKHKPENVLELTETQAQIVSAILANPKGALIHGITGSGKTEIYKSLIKNFVQNGCQCLLLVPEISLTPQFVKYFETGFPDLAVIHSRISEGKRAEIWRKIKAGNVPLVIGSRSALFSPFKKLGLIVMDEEHEWSYKQDQSPRYHARDAALKISELTGAQIIFGSATPSIETMHAAKTDKLNLFTLSERISGTLLPDVKIVDMREELRARNFSIFSDLLEQKIRTTLDAKEQTILFLNRRGSASSTLCRDCGFVMKCNHCELPLTYHARKFKTQSLLCHHCGLIEKMPTFCPNCKGERIKQLGVGTERVEAELQKLFPLARIARADRDTMNRKDSFENLHEKLQNGTIDILIGTQMIGKGFDIPNVSLVGVILADLGLHIPDFRTPERIFELLTQVAGRAGRRKKQGEVIIQTYNPQHPSILHSQTHNYLGFYEQEISSRKDARLPPFGKLVKLMFVHESNTVCEEKANTLQKILTAKDHASFAAPAFLPRVQGKYQWNVLVQGPDPRVLLKKLSSQELAGWRIDVDPILSI